MFTNFRVKCEQVEHTLENGRMILPNGLDLDASSCWQQRRIKQVENFEEGKFIFYSPVPLTCSQDKKIVRTQSQ